MLVYLVLKRHGFSNLFSRADKSAQKNWPSAPEGLALSG